MNRQLLHEDLQCLLYWEKDWGMNYHTQKFQTLGVMRKKTPVIANYNIRGHVLECVPSSKYLSFMISNHSSLKKYIQYSPTQVTFFMEMISNPPIHN